MGGVEKLILKLTSASTEVRVEAMAELGDINFMIDLLFQLLQMSMTINILSISKEKGLFFENGKSMSIIFFSLLIGRHREPHFKSGGHQQFASPLGPH